MKINSNQSPEENSFENNETEDFDEEEDVEIDLNLPRFSSFKELTKFCTQLYRGRLNLKILLLCSDIDNKEEILNVFRNYFDVEDQEDLYFLSTKDSTKSPPFLLFYGYLWFLPNTNWCLLFTFLPQKQIQKYFITPFLTKSRNIIKLWITQKLILGLFNDVKFTYDAIITSWGGLYSPSFQKKADIRPHIARRMFYKGNDAWETYTEMKDYGYNLENFSAIIPAIGAFKLNRNFGLLTFFYGDLISVLPLIKYLFQNASGYLEKIMQFKQLVYVSSLIKQREYEITNDLSLSFEDELSGEIMQEIIKKLNNSADLKVIKETSLSTEDTTFYQFKIFNVNTKGSFRILICPASVHIFQVYNANYSGAISILDILDFCQPENEFAILGS